LYLMVKYYVRTVILTKLLFTIEVYIQKKMNNKIGL